MAEKTNLPDGKREAEFYRVSREFGLSIAFWAALLLGAASLLGLLEPRSQVLECGAEKTTQQEGTLVFEGRGALFSGGALQSAEQAAEGEYSLKLSKENPFGFQLAIPRLYGSERLTMEVWRYSPGGEGGAGQMVAEVPGVSWKNCMEVEEQRGDGWEKLRCVIDLPLTAASKPLKAYCWNSGTQPIYFDEFRVELRRNYPL